MATTKVFSVSAAYTYGEKTFFKHAGFLVVLSLLSTVLSVGLMYLRLYILHEELFDAAKQCTDFACILSSLVGAAKEFVAWKLVFALATFMISAMAITVAIRVALDIYYTGKSSFARLGVLVSGLFLRLLFLYILVGAFFFGALALYFLPKIGVFFLSATKFSVIMLWLMRIVGFVLLAFGAYMVVRCMFVPFYLLDKKSSMVAACKASYAMTRKQVLPLMGLATLVWFSISVIMFVAASPFIGYALIFKKVIDVAPLFIFVGHFLGWWFFLALAYVYDRLFMATFEQLPPNPMQFM